MRRRVMVVMLAACAVAFGFANPAQAQRKGAERAKEKPAPTSERIAADLGDLQWGMSLNDVVGYFTKQIDDKYRPLIAKANTAMKEDKLRAKKRAEIQKIHDSVVRFDGKTTGWDVSFLKGEFTHKNNEALVVIRDDNSQNFYFFIQNRLWKWYKALDSRVFSGANFEKFSQAIEGRYGESAAREGEATPGAGKRQWLEWQDKATRLRAIDQTGFYGFYCLVFDDKATVRRLPELRRVKPQDQNATHSMVQQVTMAAGPGDDVHQNVADRITGRIRQREQAEKTDGKNAPSAPPPAPAPTLDDADDPLHGL